MARVRSSDSSIRGTPSAQLAKACQPANAQPASLPPLSDPQVEQTGSVTDLPEPRGLRLEWWEAERLTEHPANWRRHPARQKQALARLLREVGWAGALLYNERTGRLLDGHLRKELAHGRKVPVLVGSWSEEQERKILALLDPLSALAEPDPHRWQELLGTLAEVDAHLAEALTAFAQQSELPLLPETLTAADTAKRSVSLPPSRYEVLVECPDEASQRQLYERLTAEGWRCRVLAF